ncbi:MAG: zinc ribbon domain-containing protein [Chloroflexi bacterium]|nr:zinc ribbon domain-containing protein [Chloroflexota bacterium]
MQTCSHCNFDNPIEAQFCQQCGQPLLHQCANCGTLNAPEAKFCMKCGTNLEAELHSLDEIRLETLREAVPEKLQSRVREARDEIQGQRKPVTILFADIVGSTAMAEGLDPEEWKEVVSGAHRRRHLPLRRHHRATAGRWGIGLLRCTAYPRG